MKIGLYCGSCFFRISDWKLYGVFRFLGWAKGFSIGPILFYK